jgi:hypothetical protein
MHAWQWKGELGSDEIAMFLTLPWKMCSKIYLTKSEISCPDIIHKCNSNQMKCIHFWITFKLRDRGDDRYVSCIHEKMMQSCSSMLDPSSQWFQTGWPRSACTFMFPLRSRRNAIHMCTLENDVIHVHCKQSFLVAMVALDFDIIIFNWYNFRLSLIQLRRIEMITDLRISYCNNFYFVFKYHFVL